jgi:putative flippase GtrA
MSAAHTSSLAEGGPDARSGSPGARVAVLLRHQVGAFAATAVDFAVMIALVHDGLVSPVIATALGAACGAGTNFALGRHWVFPAGLADGPRHQAARYALVALGSLGLNTLGELALNGGAHVQYVVARLFVSALVSLGWNYPLQRRWVFAPRARP